MPELICLDRFGHQSQCQDGSTWPPVLIHLDGSTHPDGVGLAAGADMSKQSTWPPEPITLDGSTLLPVLIYLDMST